MTTHKLYLADTGIYTHTTTITHIENGDKPYVRVAETIFHPQGGGQKPDRGTIANMDVLHVAHDNGEVNHYVDSIGEHKVGDSVVMVVDKPYRHQQARYHSAGHLLAHVAEKIFPGLKAVAGHQWPDEARVDFTGSAEMPNDAAQLLERAVADEIAAGISVRMVGDPYASRALQIGDYSAVPCGGTHVTNLADIGQVKIEKIKQEKDKLRIRYSLAD